MKVEQGELQCPFSHVFRHFQIWHYPVRDFGIPEHSTHEMHIKNSFSHVVATRLNQSHAWHT